MNTKVTYTCTCKICDNQGTYILRDENVNPISDFEVYKVIASYKKETHRFLYCQACKTETKQEIVAFDY